MGRSGWPVLLVAISCSSAGGSKVPADAGREAGRDAGHEVGHDAGQDAGLVQTQDAGRDASDGPVRPVDAGRKDAAADARDAARGLDAAGDTRDAAGERGAGGASGLACDVGNCQIQTLVTRPPNTSGFFGIAADATYLYFAFQAGFGIGRVKLDGSLLDVGLISGIISAPRGVAVDGKYLYFTEYGEGTVGRANLDGSGVNENFIGAYDPIGIAVDSHYVYFANSNSNALERATLDGMNGNVNYIGGCLFPYGVAIDQHYVYWTNNGATPTTPQGAVGRANLDGTGVNQNFIPATSAAAFDLAVDDLHIYWLNSAEPGAINRANIDGTGVELGFLVVPPLADRPFGITTTSSALYWTTADAIQTARR